MNQSTDLDLRILKIKSCSSRTGQSTLNYHVGCDEEGELYFRIYGNSGHGFFNNNWVSLNAIEDALSQVGPDFTSYALKILYDHRSSNSPAFLLAALMEERLVVISTVQKRGYQKTDFGPFKERMKSLIDSSTNLDPNSKPPKITKRKQALNDDAVIETLVHS